MLLRTTTVMSASSDRAVTRQQRFRSTSPGLPPLKTAPVPREEIRQRNVAPEDRFDTVPEINPDFDMPGQRRGRAGRHIRPGTGNACRQANRRNRSDQLTYEMCSSVPAGSGDCRTAPGRLPRGLHHRDDTEQDAFEVRPEPDLGPDLVSRSQHRRLESLSVRSPDSR